MMKTSLFWTIILLFSCMVFFSSPGKAEEGAVIPTPQAGSEKKIAPSFDPILEGYKSFEQSKPQQPDIEETSLPKETSVPGKTAETLKKTAPDSKSVIPSSSSTGKVEKNPIISTPQVVPEKKNNPSVNTQLEGYKSFKQIKPQQPVIKETSLPQKTSVPDKTAETLKKTVPDAISKNPLIQLKSTDSDTGSKEPIVPVQPTTIQLPTEEPEASENIDKIKPQLDSSDIMLLHRKLLDTIAQGKIEEATALTEQLIQNDSQNSEGLLDKKKLENIHVLLKELSFVEWRLKNGKLQQAALALREIKKNAPVSEINQVADKMEAQLMKLNKRALQRDELHKDYAKGIKNLHEGRWLKAISIFTAILVKDPDYPQIREKLKEARIANYLGEGSRLIGEARIEEAEKMYQSVLELDPENITAIHQLSILSGKISQKPVSSQIQPQQAEEIDSPNVTDKPHKKTAPHESSKNQNESIEISLSSRFGNILHYLYKNQDFLKSIAAGAGGTLLFFLVIIRFGKIRKRFGTVKKLNANRILYERILEHTPNRRALYPSLASIYRQLKMEMKLPWLIESCTERLYNANSHEAPLWQLCLGEIHQEFGNLEVALREIEQAWHMDPTREEIRQKLERLYLTLLKQDPDNEEWKSGLRKLSSFFTEQASPKHERETEEKIVAAESYKEPCPAPKRREKEEWQPKRTQEEDKQILREVLGRTPPPETMKTPPPSQKQPEQTKKKPDLFSQERKKEAYEELFGQRKRQPQKESNVKTLDEP